MQRITALFLGIALVGLLAGAPAAGTSVEDERTEAIIATVAAQNANPSGIVAAPRPRPIAAPIGGEATIDDLTALTSDSEIATSDLFHGNVLYDLDAVPATHLGAGAMPLDGIAGFAQSVVIGPREIDLGDLRISN